MLFIFLQFDVTNTLNDQLLEKVHVEMEEAEGFSVVSSIPIPKLPYGHPASTYTLVEFTDPNAGVLHWSMGVLHLDYLYCTRVLYLEYY